MRWRRGFFRLWLVVSVVYVGCVGFIFYADYRDAVAYNARSTRVPVLCADVRGEAGVDYGFSRIDGAGPWDRYKSDVNPFDTCWTEMASYRRLWPESASIADQEIINAGYQSIVQETAPLLYDPTEQLEGAVKFALVPPVVLLVIGLLIAWIVSGFRRLTP